MTIAGLKDHIVRIKESNNKFVEEVVERGGVNQFLRALTAQILLFCIFQNLFVWLAPLKDLVAANLFSGAILLIIITLHSFIEDKLPTWVSDYLKGTIFYDCTLAHLNECIIGLLIFNGLVLVPNYFKFSKPKN